MTPAQILPLHLRLSINKSIGFYLALFALMLGLSSTFFTSHLLMRNVQHQIFMELEGRCDIFATRINERLDVYATILRGAAALFGASESVSRNDWREYIGILDANKNIPGVTGIGFSQIISPRQLSAHTARIRQEGFPDYSFTLMVNAVSTHLSFIWSPLQGVIYVLLVLTCFQSLFGATPWKARVILVMQPYLERLY